MDESDSQESNSEVLGSAPSAGEKGEATHWSIVLEAQLAGSPRAGEAMEELCRTYWQPLSAYIRQRGYSPEEAEDLTQDFFAHWLRNEGVRRADPLKGRFRSFLLVSVRNFLANARERANREKRGGGRRPLSLEGTAEERHRAEPSRDLTPDKLFDHSWALRLLEHTLGVLEREQKRAGKEAQFRKLSPFLTADVTTQTYARAGSELGLSREAVGMAVYRLRQQFRTLLRREIARTVSGPAEVEEELACLMAALRD